MGALRSYFLAIVGTSIIASFALTLTPEGPTRKAARLIAGLVMIVTILKPIASLSAADFSEAITKLQLNQNEAQQSVQQHTGELVKARIAQQCAAYIEDKAAELGADVHVSVSMEDGDPYPYPSGVCVRGTYTALQQQFLKNYIDENLAIPEVQQKWQPYGTND